MKSLLVFLCLLLSLTPIFAQESCLVNYSADIQLNLLENNIDSDWDDNEMVLPQKLNIELNICSDHNDGEAEFTYKYNQLELNGFIWLEKHNNGTFRYVIYFKDNKSLHHFVMDDIEVENIPQHEIVGKVFTENPNHLQYDYRLEVLGIERQ